MHDSTDPKFTDRLKRQIEEETKMNIKLRQTAQSLQVDLKMLADDTRMLVHDTMNKVQAIT